MAWGRGRTLKSSVPSQKVVGRKELLNCTYPYEHGLESVAVPPVYRTPSSLLREPGSVMEKKKVAFLGPISSYSHQVQSYRGCCALQANNTL